MDDEERVRSQRLLQEQEELRRSLERSRARVGVDPHDLQRVASAALARSGLRLDDARGESLGGVSTFHLDPADAAFREAGWSEAFDDLRVRPRKRGERLSDWRRDASVRSIAFEPPVLADGRDATDVVQVHLEHRLVRRLLSRFVSQGFQTDLSRFCVIGGTGSQARVVLMGRLALYGEGAARLHEEVIPVAAVWSDADRTRKPLRALGESGEETTLDQLEQALRTPRKVPAIAIEKVRSFIARDIADLLPRLESLAAERSIAVRAQLAKRGESEAKSLASLLEQQRERIARAGAEFNVQQLTLDLVPEERREREADRRHWVGRLQRLELELQQEPERLRKAYEVRAQRLEPVGLVYLWPDSR
jgi:hypothetical protein